MDVAPAGWPPWFPVALSFHVLTVSGRPGWTAVPSFLLPHLLVRGYSKVPGLWFLEGKNGGVGGGATSGVSVFCLDEMCCFCPAAEANRPMWVQGLRLKPCTFESPHVPHVTNMFPPR